MLEGSTCVYCGSMIKLDDEFCHNCGAKFDTESTNLDKSGVHQSAPLYQEPITNHRTHSQERKVKKSTKYSEVIGALVCLLMSIGIFWTGNVGFYVSLILASLALSFAFQGYKKPNQKNFALIIIVLSIIAVVSFFIIRIFF
ncbi:MAG: zinc-ribbon domain-containing protein [Candidatus Heimdallarchaeota archaeon]